MAAAVAILLNIEAHQGVLSDTFVTFSWILSTLWMIVDCSLIPKVASALISRISSAVDSPFAVVYAIDSNFDFELAASVPISLADRAMSLDAD